MQVVFSLKSWFIVISFWLITFNAQAVDYSISHIRPTLIEGADIVIREYHSLINIESVNKMTSQTKLVKTVYKNGNSNQIDLTFSYDPYRKIKSIKAAIYDAEGTLIKEIKKKDFRDRSATDQGTLHSDNRLLHYAYNTVSLPITIEYNITYNHKSTGFINTWNPLNNFNIAVEHSSFEIIADESLGLKTKEYNFSNFPIVELINSSNHQKYEIKNIPAIKKEYECPSWNNVGPRLSVALENFSLQGVRGTNKNWKNIGAWQYHKLIKNQGLLQPRVKAEIDQLIQGLPSNRSKAKAIYKYVQERSRYIGVQLGIGGWKPIPAQEVHDAGYGDCKGLTNYTMALLRHAGINSHYSVIYGSRNIKNIDPTHSKMEGNHVILCLPELTQGDTTWLECTSQDSPFGHIGTGTDNRNALVITPEGGFIKKTKIYKEQENLLANKNIITLDESGHAFIEHNSRRTGVLYDHIATLDYYKDDISNYYRQYWDRIHNLKIQSSTYHASKEHVNLSEKVEADASEYASVNNKELLVPVHSLSSSSTVPPRSRNRKLPIVVQRGRTERDTTQLNAPQGYRFTNIPEEVSMKTKFGEYTFIVSKKNDNSIIVNRNLIIKSGIFPADTYQEYRAFFKKINKSDQTKLLLTNKT